MSSARLTVSLDALAANYATFAQAARVGATVTSTGRRCGAVVKADGYGLGLSAVARCLAKAGCGDFFVATMEEGVALREALGTPTIYVFSGVTDAANAGLAAASNLVPVLNHAGQLDLWRAHRDRPMALHVDTGMQRLGWDADGADAGTFSRFDVKLLMTHLACADTPDHPLNQRQVDLFAAVSARFPGVPTSIGNSAGTLNGDAFQGDLCRPGIGLYGGNPYADRANPMRPVATFEGQILQVRNVKRGATLGYGATYTVTRDSVVAVVGAGYADGVPRLLSNQGEAALHGQRCPVVGRISMDAVHVDVSGVDAVMPGDWVEFFGAAIGVDEVAERAQTISYEVLTGLGARIERRYDPPA